MPSVASLEELHRAAAGFTVADVGLAIESAALAAAQGALAESGLLLLGEVHGVRENPLIIRALMQALGLSDLALEWPEELAPTIGVFLAGATLADHPLLWLGDGRITAGHLAVLRERTAAGPLSLTLFDGTVGARWSWPQRDEAMAKRILAAPAAGNGILVVAGDAHTPTTRTGFGIPLGAYLARQRPGVAEIRIRYGGGRYYNIEPRRFVGIRRGSPQPRLQQSRDALVLDLPTAREAVVPQRAFLSPQCRTSE